MRRPLGIFIVIILAVVTIPVLGITILFSLDLLAPFFDTLTVNGPGGVGKDAIKVGNAYAMLAAVGGLSIPGAILLALLVGGSRRSEPPRRPGGPF